MRQYPDMVQNPLVPYAALWRRRSKPSPTSAEPKSISEDGSGTAVCEIILMIAFPLKSALVVSVSTMTTSVVPAGKRSVAGHVGAAKSREQVRPGGNGPAFGP